MIKNTIKKAFNLLGYEIYKSNCLVYNQMNKTLKDLKKIGFYPLSILDIGANEGKWSRKAKQVFPKSKCYLIEPLIEMKPYLDKFCKKFPNSKWFLAGAGSKCKRMKLKVHPYKLKTSSFIWGGKKPSENEERTVSLITIDSLIKKGLIQKPQLVKIDVEGFELEVLKGWSKLFESVEIFILEVSLFRHTPETPLIEEVINFMKDKGYSIYDFPLLERKPYDNSLGEAYICFIKTNSRLRSARWWK